MDTLSVIVPAHNNAGVITRSLDSIEASILYFRGRAPEWAGVPVEVVVVDDSSTDDTREVAEAYARNRPYYRVVSCDGRCPAAARNAGVAASRGGVLFFLDGDDLFLPPHLETCYRALRGLKCGYVRGGVRLADPVHPEWHDAITNTLVINLCVRRECHDFVEGFPEFHLFARKQGEFVHLLNLIPYHEDVFYGTLLREWFHGYRLGVETVEYVRYPGNSYDRQYAKFCQPYGAVKDPDPPDEQARQHIVAWVVERHKLKLRQKRQALGNDGGGLPFRASLGERPA